MSNHTLEIMLVKKRANRTTRTSKEDFFSDINRFSKWGWSLFIGIMDIMFSFLRVLSQISVQMILAGVSQWLVKSAVAVKIPHK
ncbi:hypothetical protein [Rahnella sp. PCH160]|uniref:hypothetical protein n=1 Tax=Rahnella sp. PCH160 TaxID=3447928 RepID=UPI0039FC2EB4